jgi:hypothetical protein
MSMDKLNQLLIIHGSLKPSPNFELSSSSSSSSSTNSDSYFSKFMSERNFTNFSEFNNLNDFAMPNFFFCDVNGTYID